MITASPKETLRKPPANMFETVPCPVCGNGEFTVVHEGNFPPELNQEFLTQVYRSSSDAMLFEQVAKCRGCGLIYLNPRLKADLIIDSYAGGEDRTFVEQDGMRIRTFTRALKGIAAKHGLRLAKETRVLDIGCAGGAFPRAARSLGLSPVGIEPSRWLSEYARKEHGLDVRTGTLGEHDFADGQFDLVTLWDVIEHLTEPKAELAQIRRILKPEGLFVVNYPDVASLPARLLGRRWPFFLSVHLAYYTPATITRQLEQSGFRVVAIKRHWQILELGYVVQRAARVFHFLRAFAPIVSFLRLERLPLVYWIGQTQVVAKKC